jgi:O-succinylbenzoate synthase
MAFTLEEIRLREIHLELREPFQISSGTISTRRIFLLELRDASGASTWSECVAGPAPNYSPETVETAWTVIRQWIAPRLLGVRIASAADVAALLDRDFRGHEMAKGAVEMGCWGLEATIEGVPLAKLLGGFRERIATGISLGIQASPEALVERARQAIDDGYKKVKIKIKPGADLAYLEAARAALGDGAALMADANNAYTLDDVEHLTRFDDLGLIMIEQPLAWDDVVRHAQLQKQLKTPVCLDESITSLAKAEDMIALKAGRIINVKPGRVAGFTASRAIHDLTAHNAIPVWCGGMLESGIGRAYNVALASLPNFKLPGDVSPSARYWARDVVEPEWTMDDGMVRVPWDRPGLGVDVDVERIESLTVESEVLRAE